jgi:hypothetical protein
MKQPQITTGIPEPRSVHLKRSLGGLERFLWLTDQNVPVHFAMAVHIEGRTTIHGWRTALNAVQRRHPMLSVAIETNESNTPHFSTVTGARIPLRIAEAPGLANWLLEMARELATPFNAEQAPLARCVLMHEEDKSVFIFSAHHSIADGLSVAYVVRDLLHALGGEKLEALPPMPAEEPLVYSSQQGAAGAEILEAPEPPQRGRAVAFRLLDSLPTIEALRLTPERTQMLLERARTEGTTVHGALCAALVLAGREASPDWDSNEVRVLSPFSLRKQLGAGENCGVFVWGTGVTMPLAPVKEFWEMARFAKSSLAAKQALERVAIEMQGLEKAMESGVDVAGASQLLAEAFPCELLLSNLGNLPIQFETGNLKLKALWGPSVLMGFQGEQTVGVTTTNGALCLLHTSFTPIPSLLQRTEHILRAACQNFGDAAAVNGFQLYACGASLARVKELAPAGENSFAERWLGDGI